MNIVLILIKLIPTILSMVSLAERLYTDKPKSGAEKKSFVLSAVEALMGGASAVFTGGAADTWARIKEPVGTIIDAAATVAFPRGGTNEGVR